jgi:hypothetical protein
MPMLICEHDHGPFDCTRAGFPRDQIPVNRIAVNGLPLVREAKNRQALMERR